MKTSDRLEVGLVYSREDLRNIFRISDATLNTGVFQPKGYDSIWLFVTEKKTADRTQYVDMLMGDTLAWDGQTSGRTDAKIINHVKEGNEILIFYRKEKYEFSNAGFTYLGEFEYESHIKGSPSHFKLRRLFNNSRQY